MTSLFKTNVTTGYLNHFDELITTHVFKTIPAKENTLLISEELFSFLRYFGEHTSNLTKDSTGLHLWKPGLTPLKDNKLIHTIISEEYRYGRI